MTIYRTSLVAELIIIYLQCGRPGFNPWVGKIPWRRDRLPIPVFLSFSCGSAGKESTCNVGDLGLIPWVGKIPWRREKLLTPVFWPGEFHGLYSPWSHKESDTTEQPSLTSFTSDSDGPPGHQQSSHIHGLSGTPDLYHLASSEVPLPSSKLSALPSSERTWDASGWACSTLCCYVWSLSRNLRLFPRELPPSDLMDEFPPVK